MHAEDVVNSSKVMDQRDLTWLYLLVDNDRGGASCSLIVLP